MNDAYTNVFYSIVKTTEEKYGYVLPEDLEAYIVMLLAYYTDRPNFAPDDSFAESYLRLENTARINAKQLGDTCLFVTGMFPTYGTRKGLTRSYYSSIGIGSYERAAEALHSELFTQLATHFNLLSEFIEAATHSTKGIQSNPFR